MTTTEFAAKLNDILATHVDALWVGKSRNEFAAYYPEDAPATVAIIELQDWPSTWRPLCGMKIKVRMLVGKTQQLGLNPKEGDDPTTVALDIRDDLQDIANGALEAMAADGGIMITDVTPYQFFDAPEGLTLENYAWLMFEVTMKLWTS